MFNLTLPRRAGMLFDPVVTRRIKLRLLLLHRKCNFLNVYGAGAAGGELHSQLPHQM